MSELPDSAEPATTDDAGTPDVAVATDGAAADATSATRLDRQLAQAIGCSRREAQQYIEGGWVTVDGIVVESPQADIGEAGSSDIALQPGAKLEDAEPATFILNKPAGMDVREAIAQVAPAHRAPDDPFHVRMLQRHFVRRSAPLPLSANACGLVVVTQDPKVVRRLKDDRDRIEQEINVEVGGTIAMYGLARLNHGLGELAKRPLSTAKVSWQNETTLRFAIKSVQPGQIEEMCAAVGLEVQAIRRLRLGRISMGKLPAGQWRYLARHERF